MKLTIPLACLLSTALAACPAFAEVVPASVFGSHMVLQSGAAVPIWGTAAAGEKVNVTFRGTNGAAVADSTGKWRVQIGPFPVSAQPESLTIAGTSERVQLDDVLVGEVWVGSGQSNMQMPANAFIQGAKTSDQHLAQSPGDPNLQALIDAAPYPKVRLLSAIPGNNNKVSLSWTPATAENLRNFSAQLQVFGILLSQQRDVPVGLILAAVGGSPASRWLTPAAIANDPACQQSLTSAKAVWNADPAKKAREEGLKKYENDLAAWNQLPAEQKKGKPAPAKSWHWLAPGEGFRWPVGDLHDLVLAPLIGYGIRGVLWDQGESGTMVNGIDISKMMGALIRSWRQEWGQGDFPFIYVQKPSGGGCAFDYQDKVYGWAADPFLPLPPNVPYAGENRSQFPGFMVFSNTIMVPTSDLGSGLHPWNKFGYGSRDLQVALGAVYKEPVETMGPTYAESRIEDNKIRVRFSHVGKGLIARNSEKLQGFAVAGKDMKFSWADAVIDGDSVIVSNSQTAQPAYVLYGWADTPQWANLFNRDGLPALSFKEGLVAGASR